MNPIIMIMALGFLAMAGGAAMRGFREWYLADRPVHAVALWVVAAGLTLGAGILVAA